jgi:hypothetical protein
MSVERPPDGHAAQVRSPNYLVVFSELGEHISDDEYDTWYELHLDELLVIPCFQAAQRYRLQRHTEDRVAVPSRRVALYEVTAEPDEVRKQMADANLLDHSTYEELKDENPDGLALPDWWPDVRFAAWHFVPVGERLTAG